MNHFSVHDIVCNSEFWRLKEVNREVVDDWVAYVIVESFLEKVRRLNANEVDLFDEKNLKVNKLVSTMRCAK